jgi:alpha-mannosidase
MHSVGNKVASQPVVRFSVCMPASGESDVLRTLISVLNIFTNGTDHFVLRNANVQLTISEGRFSSLIDARLGLVCVHLRHCTLESRAYSQRKFRWIDYL